MSIRRRSAVSRRRRDAGVALTEAALILPLLLLLALGTIEAGFLYRDGNVVARSTQAAARIGARVADGRSADYEVLRSLESSLSATGASSIRRVIVFDATSTNGSVPTSCLSIPRPNDTSVRGNSFCNIYSQVQVETDDPTQFDGDCSSGWDTSYCPTTRNRAGSNPDRLGVYVDMTFDEVTRVVPGNVSITRTAVFQLEPCVIGDTTC